MDVEDFEIEKKTKNILTLSENQNERINILNLYFFIDLSKIITNYAGDFIPPVDFNKILNIMQSKGLRKNRAKYHCLNAASIPYYIYKNLMYRFEDYAKYESILELDFNYLRKNPIYLEQNIFLKLLENYMNASKIIEKFKNDKNTEIAQYIKICKMRANTVSACACKLLEDFKSMDVFFQDIVNICYDLRYGDVLQTEENDRDHGVYIVLKEDVNINKGKFILIPTPVHYYLPVESWPILKAKTGDYFQDVPIYCIQVNGESYNFQQFGGGSIQEEYDLIIDCVKLLND